MIRVIVLSGIIGICLFMKTIKYESCYLKAPSPTSLAFLSADRMTVTLT